MKKGVLFFICLVSVVAVFSQEKMYIHTSENITLGALLSEVDSVYFGTDGANVYFEIGDSLVEFGITKIDSISFGEDSETVLVSYNGNSVYVVNPLAFEGVSVDVNGADVIVTSALEERKIDFQLSGTTSDGMFKIYSGFKFNLVLNGVEITNNDGPAINIQTGKKCNLTLVNGTKNSLTDGSSYAESDEDQKSTLFSEGQIEFSGTGSLTVKSNGKHAICSDDYIAITDGAITISGAVKDGIHASDYFEMRGGRLNINATGDGIDCEKGYVLISGGEITTVNGSVDVKGIACDSILTITGGTIEITISGDKSKGIKSGQSMYLEGGDIILITSGDAVLERTGSRYDPSYCSAIKCNGEFYARGTDITIKSTGKAGKGISCDENINISGGTINVSTSGNGSIYTNLSGESDAYNATCITSDGNIGITNGTISVTSSGWGGKGISADGALMIGGSDSTPSVQVTTTGIEIQVDDSNSSEAKAIKADGPVIVESGTITISSSDDGIKSKESVTVNGGEVVITNSVEGIEAPNITFNDGKVSVVSLDDAINPTKGTDSGNSDGSCLYMNGGYVVLNALTGDGIDSNGNILMSGGTIIVHGPDMSPDVGVDVNGTFDVNRGFLIVSGPYSNLAEGPSTSSLQYSVIAKTYSGNSLSTLFHIEDSDGNNLVTFKPEHSYSYILFSSSDLKNGSTYYIYTAGTSTGALTDGLYNGGTYSGGTLNRSFTVSKKVTTVSF